MRPRRNRSLESFIVKLLKWKWYSLNTSLTWYVMDNWNNNNWSNINSYSTGKITKSCPLTWRRNHSKKKPLILMVTVYLWVFSINIYSRVYCLCWLVLLKNTHCYGNCTRKEWGSRLSHCLKNMDTYCLNLGKKSRSVTILLIVSTYSMGWHGLCREVVYL